MNLKNPLNYSDAEMGNAATAHVNIGLVVTVDVSDCFTRGEMLDAMRAAAVTATEGAVSGAKDFMPEGDVRPVSPKLAFGHVFDEAGHLIELVDVL